MPYVLAALTSLGVFLAMLNPNPLIVSTTTLMFLTFLYTSLDEIHNRK